MAFLSHMLSALMGLPTKAEKYGAASIIHQVPHSHTCLHFQVISSHLNGRFTYPRCIRGSVYPRLGVFMIIRASDQHISEARRIHDHPSLGSTHIRGLEVIPGSELTRSDPSLGNGSDPRLQGSDLNFHIRASDHFSPRKWPGSEARPRVVYHW